MPSLHRSCGRRWWSTLTAPRPQLVPHSVAYAAINSRASTRRRWGLDQEAAERIRRAVVAGESVAGLVPRQAIEDIVQPLDAQDEAAALVRSLGADGIAVPAAGEDEVVRLVGWARDVLAASRAGGSAGAGSGAG